jgi:hypothetical protein
MTAPLVKTLESTTVGVAAATNEYTIIGRAPYAGVVTSCEYIPEASVTGLTAATAARTLSVVNKGATGGTGTVSVASILIASGTNLVANVPTTLTLATAANRVVASGDVLAFSSTAITTGVLDPGGRVVVTYSRT